MSKILTGADIRVLDPDTYAQGNPATFGLPLDQYAYLRDNAPVYLQKFDDPMLIEQVWVLSRYADIDLVDRDTTTYALDLGYLNTFRVNPIDPTMGGMPAMLTKGGDEHRKHRSIVRQGFTPAFVRGLEQQFREYARTVVDDVLRSGTFNFVTDVAHAMPLEALGDVLGVPQQDRQRFFGWVDKFGSPFDTRITPEFEEVFVAIGELMSYSGELAQLKREHPGADAMSMMVAARDAGILTDDELMGNMVLLASGAAESTRTALSHGMHELMRNPEQMAWLRAHADDIPATAIQEIVRIATPFLHFVRTVTKDVELHGQAIGAGERVCIVMGAGNFDSEYFDEPERFDLSREKNPHLSFGRGPHACLGKHVAALEMKILMEELLQRTKDIRPAGDISYVRDTFARGVYELPVTVTPA